ncbi:MAG: tRNA lysidine(34) synthetase TilS [Planctomycetaceae bacterium]|nr:tRNA lysidine(34) synthetase TilS [Planctomycetaceae bacterium]
MAGLESAGISDGDRLLLLVSGGSDSMALLLSIAAVRARRTSFPDGIAVLTVDHGLRVEAASEVASVVAAARALGIAEVFAERLAPAARGNVLDAARAGRYDAATRIARDMGGATIVAAHQAEDRAESFLMALARREGLAACTKLMPRREFADWAGAEVARPLLDLTRDELRGFLRDCGVRWIDDPSNAAHRRGAMRTDPATRALVAEIAGGLSTVSDEAAELLALRDSLVTEALAAGLLAAHDVAGGLSCRREAFDALPPTARRALLARIAASAGVSVARTVLVEAAASEPRAVRRFTCSDGAEIVLARDIVAIAR